MKEVKPLSTRPPARFGGPVNFRRWVTMVIHDDSVVLYGKNGFIKFYVLNPMFICRSIIVTV